MSQFYEIDSTRVSLAEYWWGTKSPAVIIGWMIKWLRIRIPSSTDDPNTESTLPFIVPTLPATVSPRFIALAEELAALGYGDPIQHLIHDPGTRTTIYWATFRHSSGKYFARIHQRIWQNAQKKDRGTFLQFFTAFTDGTFFVSSAGKPDLAVPPAIQMNRMPGAPTGQLWERHQHQTAQLETGKNIAPVWTVEDLTNISERFHILVRDFNLTRGVFKVRTAEEQARADAFGASVTQAQTGGAKFPEVIAEIDKLQEQKVNGRSVIWILVLSVALFIIIGAARWEWSFTLWLIPVLLIHEGGHWVAMRLFRYRNMRMFFIPLFGAAVSGQHWNVPGWKKAIVSLAGPLPGIALGIVMGIIGLIGGKDWMVHAAFMFVFINGINLLPFLPLDGGRALQTILFCRNRWLDLAFQVMAICCLFLLSLGGLSRAALFFAIALAVGLPVAIRLAKVRDQLRTADLPAPAPGEDRIPTVTADAIVSALKVELPPGTGNKVLAQNTVNIFETLNAKPPGWIVTIGFIILQAGAFFTAALFAVLFVIGQTGGVGDFFRAAVQQGTHAYACGSSQAWTGTAVHTSPTTVQDNLVISYRSRARASAAFAELTSQLPASDRVLLFGDSVVLAMPAGDVAVRNHWFDYLQTQSKDLFVAPSNQAVMISFTFIAPTLAAATNMESELGEYFDVLSGLPLVPPWSPEYQTPAFVPKLEARRQWKRINETVEKALSDASLGQFETDLRQANQRADQQQVERLRAEQQGAIWRLQTNALGQLRADQAHPIDPRLLDFKVRLLAIASTNQVDRRAVMVELAPLLGSLNQPPGSGSFDMSFGFSSRHGMLLQIGFVPVLDPVNGVPAIADWLCGQHCTGMRYDFQGALNPASGDDSDQ